MPAPNVVSTRPAWQSVAIPSEHGGWGLTLEPVLLGLLVEPSLAGGLLGIAAFVAFVARTPLRVLLVDARRGRSLDRTSLAARILAVEVVLLGALVVGAAATGDGRMWWPVLAAAPLVAVELWFDMRSRSRRLVPELAGAIGIAAVVAMIVLAGGAEGSTAIALWLILSARVATSIPFVRQQVALIHGRRIGDETVLFGDAAAVLIAAAAVAVEGSVLAGAITIAVIIVYQRLTARRPPPRAAILGARQSVAGLTLVFVTALGVLAP